MAIINLYYRWSHDGGNNRLPTNISIVAAFVAAWGVSFMANFDHIEHGETTGTNQVAFWETNQVNVGAASKPKEVSNMSKGISLSCSAAPKVDRQIADQICSELLTYLSDSYPDRNFSMDNTSNPRIVVAITSANERSIGFEIDWIAANGRASTGTPLHRAFYDRNSNPELRRRFYQYFFETNPLPF